MGGDSIRNLDKLLGLLFLQFWESCSLNLFLFLKCIDLAGWNSLTLSEAPLTCWAAGFCFHFSESSLFCPPITWAFSPTLTVLQECLNIQVIRKNEVYQLQGMVSINKGKLKLFNDFKVVIACPSLVEWLAVHLQGSSNWTW